MMPIIRPALALLFVLSAVACNQTPPSAPQEAAIASAEPSLWFICDAINAHSVFVFEKDASGSGVQLTEYGKSDGAIAHRALTLGAAEGAGSVYTSLMDTDAEVGAVRNINPGMLETPAAVYTTPFTSLTLGERAIMCRWLARTRLIAFSDRRSLAITEDADGDLIYTTFNFADAAAAQPIDLSDGGRSTTFSLEVRGGEEMVTPSGAEYRFENGEYAYVVTAPTEGQAHLEVLRGGRSIQTEPLIAVQTGAGEE
jgi:hypothetical protein